MANLLIRCTDSSTVASVVEVFQRGTNGQPDILMKSGLVTTGAASAEVAMPDGCYAVMRAATEDEAKSIDNW